MLAYAASIILFVIGIFRNDFEQGIRLVAVSAFFMIAFAIECNAPSD